MYPKIVDSVSPQSGLLSWTHYRVLIQVEDSGARNGMKKKHLNRSGVYVHYKGIYLRNTTIEFLKHRIKQK